MKRETGRGGEERWKEERGTGIGAGDGRRDREEESEREGGVIVERRSMGERRTCGRGRETERKAYQSNS